LSLKKRISLIEVRCNGGRRIIVLNCLHNFEL
jgi:hypothetical protein